MIILRSHIIDCLLSLSRPQRSASMSWLPVTSAKSPGFNIHTMQMIDGINEGTSCLSPLTRRVRTHTLRPLSLNRYINGVFETLVSFLLLQWFYAYRHSKASLVMSNFRRQWVKAPRRFMRTRLTVAFPYTRETSMYKRQYWQIVPWVCISLENSFVRICPAMRWDWFHKLTCV